MVLVGGGHAHVQVLTAFAAEPPPDCNITVVAAEAVAMYSGMAPGFVAGQYTREQLEIDVRPLARRCGARAIVAACERVDPEARLIHVAGHPPLPYDAASFNIGSTVLGLELPGVREHTLPTRPLSRLVEGVAGLVERGQAHAGSAPFHVVVVGGGVGGVELAFTAQARLVRETGRPVAVTILDASPRILGRYPDALIRRVDRLCAKRGITVRGNVRVAAVDADHVRIEDGAGAEALACDAVIWVTGPTGHPVFARSPGVRTDERGFACIRSTLQLEDHDELFAVGDCGTLIDHPQTPKAGVYAVRQGPFVARNLRALLAGRPLEAYHPQGDFLTLLNVGGGLAVGAKWGVTFGGRWVMRWKDHIDRKFMAVYQLPWDEDDAA
jgi:selenide,water dikinase